MKKLAIILTFITSSALAQTASPSLDEMTNQWLIETGQLRMELAKARGEVSRLMKQIESAKKSESEKTTVSPPMK
jgi:hypothetical protein